MAKVKDLKGVVRLPSESEPPARPTVTIATVIALNATDVRVSFEYPGGAFDESAEPVATDFHVIDDAGEQIAESVIASGAGFVTFQFADDLDDPSQWSIESAESFNFKPSATLIELTGYFSTGEVTLETVAADYDSAVAVWTFDDSVTVGGALPALQISIDDGDNWLSPTGSGAAGAVVTATYAGTITDPAIYRINAQPPNLAEPITDLPATGSVAVQDAIDIVSVGSEFGAAIALWTFDDDVTVDGVLPELEVSIDDGDNWLAPTGSGAAGAVVTATYAGTITDPAIYRIADQPANLAEPIADLPATGDVVVGEEP